MFVIVEMGSFGNLTWIIYLKRQHMISSLPLSAFWFSLKEGRVDSTLCLLIGFAYVEIVLPFRKFGTYQTPFHHKCT